MKEYFNSLMMIIIADIIRNLDYLFLSKMMIFIVKSMPTPGAFDDLT